MSGKTYKAYEGKLCNQPATIIVNGEKQGANGKRVAAAG